MAIRYEAYTWSGEKVSGVLETDSEADAYEKLQQEQLIPYRLAPIRPRRPLVRLAPSLFKPKQGYHRLHTATRVSNRIRHPSSESALRSV